MAVDLHGSLFFAVHCVVEEVTHATCSTISTMQIFLVLAAANEILFFRKEYSLYWHCT